MASEQPRKIIALLVFFARKIISKYQPFVIGITGSVGKTSTRHAIACALAGKYKLREPIKNYNNEIGIPLTIIGAKGTDEETSWFGAKLALVRIVLKALVVWLLPQTYPKMLALEYGIDRPGDMDKYLAIVKPELSVFTSVGISHREFFDSKEQIAFEKGKLAAALPATGTYVYNGDDALVASQAERTEASKIAYGWASAGNNVQVKLVNVEETLSVNPQTTLHIQTPSRELRVSVPVLGTAHVQAVLAAVAVAEALEVETDIIIDGLRNYRPVPGRLSVLAGIKRSVLIDDSYNAAPVSTEEALKLLSRFLNPIKMAVLGDMLELGPDSDKGHAEVGRMTANLKLSKLITVGELGKKIALAAEQSGMPAENIISFHNSTEAQAKILDYLEPESVVLVKGSQGVRMEKISKELLAEPMSATQVLPRQYGKWLKS